ncbi:Hypothetical predicted protein, partial [Mytilus galloprovincialis]
PFHPAISGVGPGQRIYRIPCSTCEADPQQTEKWIRGEPEILAETGDTRCLIMELPFRPEIQHNIWTTAYRDKERMLNRIPTLEDELDNIRENTREDNIQIKTIVTEDATITEETLGTISIEYDIKTRDVSSEAAGIYDRTIWTVQ